MIPKDAQKAIAKHFEIPPDIQRLANQATWDLYYGPGCDEGEDEEDAYPGFSTACAQVSAWCGDALSEVWYEGWSECVLDCEPKGYDAQCDECSGHGVVCFHDAEPEEECPTCAGSGETWVEPMWEDYYHVELRDVKRALFDKELCAHI